MSRSHLVQQVRRWMGEHGVWLGALVLWLVLSGVRSYWAPDEPDFAQCVKEMRLRGDWMFPWLNGAVYTEKPILFYWLMSGAARLGEWLTGGLGFDRGIAAWALRLPSVAAATGMLLGVRAWGRRFLDGATADRAMLILATSPLWVWQGQFLQIDMLFSVLLAGALLAWGGGLALEAGWVEAKAPGESRRWFLGAYLALGLAVLSKGPLAVVLAGACALGFLLWEGRLDLLRRAWILPGLLVLLAVVLPWYVGAALRGGPAYAYAMIVHQNLNRALRAWDHIQPWWRYAWYLAANFFPWSLLLLPALGAAWRQRRELAPLRRFVWVGALLPILLLSFSQSKQGKYLLPCYPFLALGIAGHWEGVGEATRRRLVRLALGILMGAGLALVLLGFHLIGGRKAQAQVEPFLGPLRLGGIVLLGAAAWAWRARLQVRALAGVLGAFLVAVGPWTFQRLEAQKGFRRWAVETEPLLTGRNTYFWGEIRSGAMIYSDRLLPEIRTAQDLARLHPGDCLVTPWSRWALGSQGLDAATLAAFQVVYRQPRGGDGLVILQRRVN